MNTQTYPASAVVMTVADTGGTRMVMVQRRPAKPTRPIPLPGGFVGGFVDDTAELLRLVNLANTGDKHAKARLAIWDERYDTRKKEMREESRFGA